MADTGQNPEIRHLNHYRERKSGINVSLLEINELEKRHFNVSSAVRLHCASLKIICRIFSSRFKAKPSSNHSEGAEARPASPAVVDKSKAY